MWGTRVRTALLACLRIVYDCRVYQVQGMTSQVLGKIRPSRTQGPFIVISSCKFIHSNHRNKIVFPTIFQHTVPAGGELWEVLACFPQPECWHSNTLHAHSNQFTDLNLLGRDDVGVNDLDVEQGAVDQGGDQLNVGCWYCLMNCVHVLPEKCEGLITKLCLIVM